MSTLPSIWIARLSRIKDRHHACPEVNCIIHPTSILYGTRIIISLSMHSNNSPNRQRLLLGIQQSIVNNRILEVYVKTIKQISEESPLLFVKALMCIDKKINPSSMRPYEQQALIVCASQFVERKKKVQYLDDSVYELFDEIINNGTKRILELSDDEDETNDKELN